MRLFELPQGQTLCPYHYEYVEEWLLVMVGEVQVRTPAGVAPARAGDLVCFPTGAAGAHNIWNDRERDSARRDVLIRRRAGCLCLPRWRQGRRLDRRRARPLDVPRSRRAPRLLRRRAAADATSAAPPASRGYPEASMVDPRIYRGFLVVVAFAVIVFGFSLRISHRPRDVDRARAVLHGPAVDDPRARATASPRIARPDRRATVRSPPRRSAAAGENNSGISGFSVRNDSFSAQTTAGQQTLENVIATRPGLGSGTIVVVSHRDAVALPGQGRPVQHGGDVGSRAGALR